ncbi:hypothetical protein E2C01_072452 [Portunus trituberculatus]|uniref:Uncharacterized protein n=1 Tax=Portunus trituberculatus TaxID=210409 RepID=A0A5B7I2M8_PORTR|nr:hypothetical protein [Portunus trituberculatus]
MAAQISKHSARAIRFMARFTVRVLVGVTRPPHAAPRPRRPQSRAGRAAGRFWPARRGKQ